MCETCSPFCGNCKPPAYKVVLCPACGKPRLFTRDEALEALGRPHRRGRQRTRETGAAEGAGRAVGRATTVGAAGGGVLTCAGCGADLMEGLRAAVTPLECRYSGIVCGYPCGRRMKEHPPGEGPCVWQVPLAAAPR